MSTAGATVQPGNFEGHELRTFGFHIAREQGLEYLTPFDYQGPDAGSEIWGETLDLLSARAVRAKHGLEEGYPGWEERVEQFVTFRRAFDRSRDERAATG